MIEIRRGLLSQTTRTMSGSLELDHNGSPMLAPGETLMGLHYQFGLQVTDGTQIEGHYVRLRAVGVAFTSGSPPPQPALPVDSPSGDEWLWWERVNFLPDGMSAYQAPDGGLGVRQTHSRRAAGADSGSLWFCWQGGAADGDIFQAVVGWSAVVLVPDAGTAAAPLRSAQLAMV